jgi:hypothetical protein
MVPCVNDKLMAELIAYLTEIFPTFITDIRTVENRNSMDNRMPTIKRKYPDDNFPGCLKDIVEIYRHITSCLVKLHINEISKRHNCFYIRLSSRRNAGCFNRIRLCFVPGAKKAYSRPLHSRDIRTTRYCGCK